jgi:hypothetical protein
MIACSLLFSPWRAAIRERDENDRIPGVMDSTEKQKQ